MGYPLLYVALCGYALFCVLLAIGWWRARLWARTRITEERVPAGILVPFRNERLRLEPLVRFIKNHAEDDPRREFRFIDDHSDDGSAGWLREELAGLSNVHILALPEGRYGKKAALTLGIQHTRNSSVITLDADCTPTATAILWMEEALSAPGIQLTAGAVWQDSGPGFGGRLADLEFLSLIGSGISFWGLGMPFMANGAFLGFKKQAFADVDGFTGNEQFPGGDDVFLLQKITRRFGNRSIRFLSAADEAVKTAGDGSRREFFQRRIRWGAKAKAYQGFAPRVATLGLFVLQTLYLLAFLSSLLFGRLPEAAFLLFVKLLSDILLLTPMLIRLRQMRLWPYILPASPLHPFYLFATGCLALWGRYRWKKRNYTHPA